VSIDEFFHECHEETLMSSICFPLFAETRPVL